MSLCHGYGHVLVFPWCFPWCFPVDCLCWWRVCLFPCAFPCKRSRCSRVSSSYSPILPSGSHCNPPSSRQLSLTPHAALVGVCVMVSLLSFPEGSWTYVLPVDFCQLFPVLIHSTRVAKFMNLLGNLLIKFIILILSACVLLHLSTCSTTHDSLTNQQHFVTLLSMSQLI